MRSLLALFLLIIFSIASFAAQAHSPQVLEESEQLLVVLTPNWDSFQGKLLFFQRARAEGPWAKIEGPLAVVVGKKGTGWGLGTNQNIGIGPIKKEGDGRSPVGIFKIGPAFGFLDKAGQIKLDYFPLTETSFCVDDTHSRYYNQLLDRASIANPDWNSGEVMREVPLYQWGSVIQHNQNPIEPGSGSCVFLHIWRGPNQGTAGCIALEESSLTRILAKLDPKKKPAIAIFSEPAYQVLKKDWNLPALENVLNQNP